MSYSRKNSLNSKGLSTSRVKYAHSESGAAGVDTMAWKEVGTAVDAIALEIVNTPALRGSLPYLVLMLNEWVSFGVDLSRSLDKLNFPHRITYMHLAENAPEEAEAIRVIADIPKDLNNQSVIIAGNIADTSRMAEKSIALCKERGSKAIFTAFNANQRSNKPLESKDIALEFVSAEDEALSSPCSLKKIENIQREVNKFELIATRAQVLAAVDRVAQDIANTPALVGKKPYVIYVMNGGVYFGVDLSRSLDKLQFPHRRTYMHLGSYGDKYQGGSVEVIASIPASIDLTDQVVIIAEDVLDRGVTAAKTVDLCLSRGAAAVYTAFLAHKPNKRLEEHKNIVPDFVGFDCDDRFLLGEGLDVQGSYRAYQGGGLFAFDPESEKRAVLSTKQEEQEPPVLKASFSSL